MSMMNNKEKGISNTIGTIILVAVVVALVALVVFLVFNFAGGDDGISESPEASVDLTATGQGIKATVLQNENVEKFIIDTPQGEFPLGEEPGDVTETNSGTGEYAVIAVLPDGTSQVIATSEVTQTSDGGFFVVTQYEDDSEAYAEIVETYDGVDDYDIIVVGSDDGGDTSTASYNPKSEKDKNTLSIDNKDYEQKRTQLSNSDEYVTYNEKQLLGISVAPGKLLALANKPEIFPIANISKRPDKSEYGPGQQIGVHKMTNLCKGDEIHLVNDTGSGDEREVLAVGEEIKFNSSGCGSLRKVAKYQGNEIVGVKLINLWHKSLDYSVFSFDGDVPPPKQPVDKGGSKKIEVEVYNNSSSDPIGSATVNLGNLTNKTNSSGEALFKSIKEESKTVYATAQKSGYYSNSTPVELDGTGTLASIPTAEVRLDPRSDDGVPDVDADATSQSISPGSTVNIDVSDSTSSGTTIGKSSVTIAGGTGSSSSSSTSSGGSGGSVTTSSGGGTFSGSGGSLYESNSVPASPSFSAPVETSSSDGGGGDGGSDSSAYTGGPTQPTRQFKTVPVNDTVLPTETGKFKIQTSVKAVGEPESGNTIPDEVIVTAKNENGDNVSLTGPDGSNQRVQVSLVPGEINVVSQTFAIPSDGNGGPGNYTIFVTLNSSSKIQTAGTLEAFSNVAQDVTVNGGSVTPENPRISGGTEDLTITVDDSDINFGSLSSSDEFTIDIFENGNKIKRKTVSGDATGTLLTHTRTHEEPGYYTYHIGVLESQDVALADTVLVQKEISSSIDLHTNISVTGNQDGCQSITSNSGQFDCEINVGDTIEYKADVKVNGSDVDKFNDSEILLTWDELPDGNKTLYADNNYSYDSETGTYQDSDRINFTDDLTTYDPSNYEPEITGFGEKSTVNITKQATYDEASSYIAEIRIFGTDEKAGETIGMQDDILLNVVKDKTKVTSKIKDAKPVIGSDDTGNITIESGRSSFQETVDVGFWKVQDDGTNTLVSEKKNISIPRSGTEKNIIKSFNIANFRLSSESPGENVTVHIGLSNNTTDVNDYSSSDMKDKSTLEFEIVPAISVDSTIRPIACSGNNKIDNIVTSVDNIGDFSKYDIFDSKSDAESTMNTPLSNVYLVDPAYWDDSTDSIDASAINDTGCTVAGYSP